MNQHDKDTRAILKRIQGDVSHIGCGVFLLLVFVVSMFAKDCMGG